MPPGFPGCTRVQQRITSKGSHTCLQIGASHCPSYVTVEKSGSEAGSPLDESIHELYYFTKLYVVGNGQTYHPLYYVNIKVNVILVIPIFASIVMSDLGQGEGGVTKNISWVRSRETNVILQHYN